ncbi:MAG: cysteine desulfurase [Bacteroidota bacterium]|nr:cysteine desulfurase [Bacteroidota bacterium]
MRLNIEKIRLDFPILNTQINDRPLVYLDNAATTQKPFYVTKALEKYYKETNSNVHRGNHFLSQKATEEFENSRKIIQGLINANSEKEIIFTKGTTESINLIANVFGKKYINGGDEIIISEMEHHSNIVPWQIVCSDRKAKLKIIPINDNGEIIFGEFEQLITNSTKIIAINHVSNTLGTINPIKRIIKKAHENNIAVLIDGAQAVPHLKIDVQELDCDFYCFSGHKVFGPTGTGVLFGKEKILNKLPPYQGGGEMISNVTFEETTFNELPYIFEAGTPNIAGFIALAEAIKYFTNIGLEDIADYESELLEYATKMLLQIEGLKIIGTATNKASVISFVIDGIHSADIGTLLDQMGIAVRVGNHCTQPIMERFKINGAVRASFAFYNTFEEIDILYMGLKRAVSMLRD